MARLLQVRYAPQVVNVRRGEVVYEREMVGEGGARLPVEIAAMPVILWSDGTLWDEANLYLASRAEYVSSKSLSIETVQNSAWALRDYASFLERSDIEWSAFGHRRAARPTHLYRGSLIQRRNADEISPATASARMSRVIAFYRWVQREGLLSSAFPAFEEKSAKVTSQDQYGFARTFTVETSDLAIPNRGRNQLGPEDGLHPVSLAQRKAILDAANEHCSAEFALMLEIGFCTGMRLQSILDLKTRTLDGAIKGQTDRAAFLHIGPRHGVATKGDVSGSVFIPLDLLTRLRNYAQSTRRLKRRGKASSEDSDLIFINKFGRRYGRRGEDRSPSINVDMGRLRAAMRNSGVDIGDFKFHCTRATFGTHVVVAGLNRHGLSISAVLERVRTLLLHKSIATSMRYIKYVEDMTVMAEIEEEFDRWMFAQS